MQTLRLKSSRGRKTEPLRTEPKTASTAAATKHEDLRTCDGDGDGEVLNAPTTTHHETDNLQNNNIASLKTSRLDISKLVRLAEGWICCAKKFLNMLCISPKGWIFSERDLDFSQGLFSEHALNFSLALDFIKRA